MVPKNLMSKFFNLEKVKKNMAHCKIRMKSAICGPKNSKNFESKCRHSIEDNLTGLRLMA